MQTEQNHDEKISIPVAKRDVSSENAQHVTRLS
jgi:hypothetical protein